jgi:hypothetical protein
LTFNEPAVAGLLKAFGQIARSQAVREALAEKAEVDRLLHRELLLCAT